MGRLIMTDREMITAINQRRKEKKVSQEELAKMVGVTRTAVNKWLQCIYFPTITDYLAMCKALGLTLVVIATED